MSTILTILMHRDGMCASDAMDLIDEAKEQLQEYTDAGDYESAYNICDEFFGLEPCYLMEVME